MHGIPFPRYIFVQPQIVQLLAFADKRNIGNRSVEDGDDPQQNLNASEPGDRSDPSCSRSSVFGITELGIGFDYRFRPPWPQPLGEAA